MSCKANTKKAFHAFQICGFLYVPNLSLPGAPGMTGTSEHVRQKNISILLHLNNAMNSTSSDIFSLGKKNPALIRLRNFKKGFSIA